MFIDFIFETNKSEKLLDNFNAARATLKAVKIKPSDVVSLESDFSDYSIAYLLALIENKNIIVPVTDAVGDKRIQYLRIAKVSHRLIVSESETKVISKSATYSHYSILQELARRKHPGLILFSSGSTGEPKAAVHDFVPLLEKFKTKRQAKVMMSFLMFDHIGGINTLFYCLSNNGEMVIPRSRDVDHVCSLIQERKVQILPTTPTFLNLLLLNRAHEKYDLSSLETITYGTEPMPEATLKRLHAAFPNVTLQQTYGLSELGIMRSKSRANDSLWVKIGGEGYDLRVVNGMLEVKAKSAMLGYLNAPSPFTDDGWLKTGDAVEVDGDYYKILGRKSELINVGGEKVYPAEVEGVLAEMSGVETVVVQGVPHPLMGTIVQAVVKLTTNEALYDFRKRMREYCKGRLEPFKVPQKVVYASDLINPRFKTDRRIHAEI